MADLLFTPGSYVRCGRSGVCLVEDVQTMSVAGTAREREDYTLQSAWAGLQRDWAVWCGGRFVVCRGKLNG